MIWEIPLNSFSLQSASRLRSRCSSTTSRKPCCLARSRTQGSSSIKRFRVIACPVLETTLTCARPLRGDKNMKTMTAQKMNATGGIQAGGKCWTLQIEPPTAKTQYQWRKKHKNKTFLFLYTTIGKILLCNTSLWWRKCAKYTNIVQDERNRCG